MKNVFGLQLASKIQRNLEKSLFPAMAGATDIFERPRGKITRYSKALRLLLSSSKRSFLRLSSVILHDAKIPQNPVSARTCGFDPRHRHHVRRTQLRSVSAVCVRAAKTAHPLSPSSFPKSDPLRRAPIWNPGTFGFKLSRRAETPQALCRLRRVL